MRKIIFLQSKLPENEVELRQLLERWKMYGDLLAQQKVNSAIWVFTPHRLSDFATDLLGQGLIRQFQVIEGKKSTILRFIALRKQIKSEEIRTALICGDNQESLLMALALKISLGPLIGIQIQIHGNTYSFGVNRGIKGILRVFLSRVGFIAADSIRVVSKFQIEEIEKLSGGATKKFVLAPIPIDFSRVALTSMPVRFEVAFIGRLHLERGISELIQLVKMLKIRRPETTIVLVGDGSLRNKVKNELSRWLDDSTISVPGFYSAEQIREVYATSRILVLLYAKQH
jgi:glycosyltransferase involved in cell wall biosynthesis